MVLNSYKHASDHLGSSISLVLGETIEAQPDPCLDNVNRASFRLAEFGGMLNSEQDTHT